MSTLTCVAVCGARVGVGELSVAGIAKGFNAFPGFAQLTQDGEAAAGKRARQGDIKEIRTCSLRPSGSNVLAEATRGTLGQPGHGASTAAPLPKFCIWAFRCTQAKS